MTARRGRPSRRRDGLGRFARRAREQRPTTDTGRCVDDEDLVALPTAEDEDADAITAALIDDHERGPERVEPTGRNGGRACARTRESP